MDFCHFFWLSSFQLFFLYGRNPLLFIIMYMRCNALLPTVEPYVGTSSFFLNCSPSAASVRYDLGLASEMLLPGPYSSQMAYDGSIVLAVAVINGGNVQQLPTAWSSRAVLTPACLLSLVFLSH